jgi:hypothetical protein
MGKVDASSRKMASKGEDETIITELIVSAFERMESEAPKIETSRHATALIGFGNSTRQNRVGSVGLWTCEQRLEGNTTRILCIAWKTKYGGALGQIAYSESMADSMGPMRSS